MPSTLADVARLAGVSLATASKALNNRHDVRASTRERVLKAATSLSFTPNSLALGLSRGRSGTVGLLTSDLEGRFSLPILMGAEDAFGAGELSVVLSDARGDSARERRLLGILLSRQIDGLMVVGNRTDTRVPVGTELPVPTVYVYQPSSDPEDWSITPDNVQGARAATEHLVAIGRRRIARIAGVPGQRASVDRGAGVRQALAGTDAELIDEAWAEAWSERRGRLVAGRVLQHHPEIDALVCDSDQIARGVLDAVRETGRRVPEDVAVIGFDNWEIVAAESQPGLSSVDMNLERLGRLAAETLFTAIQGDAPAPSVRLEPCSLVVRGSTVSGADGE